MSRATVANCIRLIGLPAADRVARVAELDGRENESRELTYTHHTCQNKGCRGSVRVVRSATNHPHLCTPCYLKGTK